MRHVSTSEETGLAVLMQGLDIGPDSLKAFQGALQGMFWVHLT